MGCTRMSENDFDEYRCYCKGSKCNTATATYQRYVENISSEKVSSSTFNGDDDMLVDETHQTACSVTRLLNFWPFTTVKIGPLA